MTSSLVNRTPRISRKLFLCQKRGTYYVAVAEVTGNCPPRLFGYPTTGTTTCFLTLFLDCQIFPEDSQLKCGLEQFALSNSRCRPLWLGRMEESAQMNLPPHLHCIQAWQQCLLSQAWRSGPQSPKLFALRSTLFSLLSS